MRANNLESTTKQRLFFLDNLKAFIILLMVIFHVAMGYTTWDLKWWTVNDIEKHHFFDLFVFETDVYIMPIMFLIAGYFSASPLCTNSLKNFWRNKLARIIIPWIIGVLGIAPLIAYSTPFSRMDNPPSYYSFILTNFFGPSFQQGPFWFLGVLTLFFLLLTVAYQLQPSYFKKAPQMALPSLWFFPIFALLTALPFFLTNLFVPADLWFNKLYIISLQPVRLVFYACYFSLGVYAWHKAWFTTCGYKPNLWGWAPSMIVMMFVYVAYRVAFTLVPTIPVLHKAGYALIFSCFSLSATLGLISIFYHFINTNAYLWRRLSANSYTIYIIHQCVVIPIAYFVKNIHLNIFVKYIGVSISALILCFLLSEYLITPLLFSKKKTINS